MGERLKKMEYKVHNYDKVQSYNPKIQEYKLPEARKPQPYKLPDMGKSKIPNYKIQEYKVKDYRYKEYVPPWERGEIRKKKMRAVARLLPKKPKEIPRQPKTPVKTEPKPKPKQEPKIEKNKEVKPKPKPPPPPPPPPVQRIQPEVPKKRFKDESIQTTPPRPAEDEATEVMYPTIDYESRRTETQAQVFINDVPPPSPDVPLYKPVYTPLTKGGTGKKREPRNPFDPLDF